MEDFTLQKKRDPDLVKVKYEAGGQGHLATVVENFIFSDKNALFPWE